MISPTSPPQVALASPATEVASPPPPSSLVVLSRPKLHIKIPKDRPTPADLIPSEPSDLPFGSPCPRTIRKASTQTDPRPMKELIRITQEFIKTNGI